MPASTLPICSHNPGDVSWCSASQVSQAWADSNDRMAGSGCVDMLDQGFSERQGLLCDGKSYPIIGRSEGQEALVTRSIAVCLRRFQDSVTLAPLAPDQHWRASARSKDPL